jgi:O-antigen/teichoic acid export membrane protein
VLNYLGSLASRLAPRYWQLVETNPLARRLAGGAFWSLTAAVITRLANLAASVVVARLLGKEGFGEYGIIQSTISMFGMFAGFGLGLTATKYVAEFRQSDPAKAGRILGISTLVVSVSGTFLCIALLTFSPWLASRTLAAPQLAGPLRIGALLMLITAFNGAQTGALMGLEAFKVIARVNLYAGLLTLPFVVTGVVFLGLEGALWGLVAGAVVNWVLNHLVLRRETIRAGIPLTFKDCLRERQVVWAFSLPAVLSSMLAAPVNWVCNTLLVNQPNGYAEMGIVNAANQWFSALLFLPGVLARYTIPVLSERLGSEDRTACRKILRYSTGLNAAVVIPLVLVGCLASRYIMAIYGPGFSDHWAVAVAALLTAAVLAIQMPMGQMTAASGRMWMETCMNLGWALLFCGATWLWVSYGALGLTSARLVAYVAHTAWTAGFVVWILRQKGQVVKK